MSSGGDEVCSDCGEPFVGTNYGRRVVVVLPLPSGGTFTMPVGRLAHHFHGHTAFNGLVPEKGVRPPVP